MPAIETIDTHTGGEPTRIVILGGPDLGSGTMSERLQMLRSQHDWLRTTLILEPRGSDWIVGALLQEPVNSECVAGIIFFNNVGYLGMCGHGLIGVVEALAYLGRISVGEHQFETPVGVVSAKLNADRSVTITNVESFRLHTQVNVDVPETGIVTGDVAYGGNWFFLTAVSHLNLAEIESLTGQAQRISTALREQGVCGANGVEIDHVELFGPPSDPSKADSQSFVLCPGGEYDRSPCGTGTSAKLACLAADGRLQPGEVWRQESIIGSVFEGQYSHTPNGIAPVITGRAFVTGKSTWVQDDDDPFRFGIEG